ncbi:MAG: flagellar motor protein [Acidobacteria bacterium]|nr:flagellar motor protein [Acidobacteriota bacterium]MBI3655382.1 flagellar motor protein [Acidobacteriota bacterium]
MDLATILGFIIAAVGILGGQAIEGGSLMQILQPTAAMIVGGGTMGAVMIAFPLKTFIGSIKSIKDLFFDKAHSPEELVKELVSFATKARKEGLVSLEPEIPKTSDEFLGEALRMAVDGIDPKEMRQSLELRIEQMEEHAEDSPKVFEAAGGFAPTIGIIGAVLGLIQVMQHLDNIEEVGKGIAVAFVATIYGVGLANIVFLPAANKLKLKAKHGIKRKYAMLDAVASIVEGMNPRLIDAKLRSYFVGEIPNSADSPSADRRAA